MCDFYIFNNSYSFLNVLKWCVDFSDANVVTDGDDNRDHLYIDQCCYFTETSLLMLSNIKQIRMFILPLFGHEATTACWSFVPR